MEERRSAEVCRSVGFLPKEKILNIVKKIEGAVQSSVQHGIVAPIADLSSFLL
jgi:hypothetical protein